MKKYNTSVFMQNVLTLMKGTTFSAVLPVLVSPVLSRIYSPEDFGVFAIFLQIVTILSIISTCRYEFSIVLTKDNKEASDVLQFSIINIICISVFIFIVMLILGSFDITIVNNVYQKGIFLFIPILVFFTATARTFEQFSISKGNFSFISVGKILQSSIASIFHILFGILGLGIKGLIIGSLSGFFVYNINLFKKSNIIVSFKNFSYNAIKIVAVKYKQFAIFDLPNILLAIAGQRAFGVLLFIYAGPEFTGAFFLAERIIKKPGTILTKSLQNPIYQFQTTLERERRIIANDAIHKSKIIFYFLPIYIVILFLPSQIYTFIFGQSWLNLKLFVDVFLMLFFLRLIFTPFSFVYRIFQRQDIALKLRILELFKVFAMLFIFNYTNEPAIIVLWFAILSSFVIIVNFLYTSYFLLNRIYWPSLINSIIVITTWYLLYSKH